MDTGTTRFTCRLMPISNLWQNRLEHFESFTSRLRFFRGWARGKWNAGVCKTKEEKKIDNSEAEWKAGWIIRQTKHHRFSIETLSRHRNWIIGARVANESLSTYVTIRELWFIAARLAPDEMFPSQHIRCLEAVKTRKYFFTTFCWLDTYFPPAKQELDMSGRSTEALNRELTWSTWRNRVIKYAK